MSKKQFLLFFGILFSLNGFSEGIAYKWQWGKASFPRINIAYSVSEALTRPSAIRQLFVWDFTEEEKEQMPKLINLEILSFGWINPELTTDSPKNEFPVEFCRLPKLKSIFINNAIPPITDSLCRLKSLRKIWCNYTLPESVSLLDSLEEISAPMPAFPWPGKFSGLKRLNTYPALPVSILTSFTSFEELSINLNPESGRDDSLIAALTEFKNIRKLCVYSTGVCKLEKLNAVFERINSLPLLDELQLGELVCEQDAPGNYQCEKLRKIHQLKIYGTVSVFDFFPERLDSLKSLEIESTCVGMDIPFHPEELFKRLPPLRNLVFRKWGLHCQYERTWLEAISRMKNQAELDTLIIINGSQWKNSGYVCYDYPGFSNDTGMIVMNQLIAIQKHLVKLEFCGFILPELHSLSRIIGQIPCLKEACLILIAKDGRPFDTNLLTNDQRRNWVLLRDQYSAARENKWQPLSTNSPMAWKLLSEDYYFISTNGYEPGKENAATYFSSLPLNYWPQDSLPVYVRLRGVNDFTVGETHPVLIEWNVWGKDTIYYESWVNYELDDLISSACESPAYNYYRKTVFTKRFPNGIPQTSQNGNSEIRWSEDGILTWCSAEQAFEYCWNSKGELVYIRINHSGRIAELRFSPGNYLLSEGWLDEKMNPAGTWYYFDEAGNCSKGKAPKKLRNRKT